VLVAGEAPLESCADFAGCQPCPRSGNDQGYRNLAAHWPVLLNRWWP